MEAWKTRTTVLADLVSCEGLLPDGQLSVITSHGRRVEWVSGGSFIKDTAVVWKWFVVCPPRVPVLEAWFSVQ